MLVSAVNAGILINLFHFSLALCHKRIAGRQAHLDRFLVLFAEQHHAISRWLRHGARGNRRGGVAKGCERFELLPARPLVQARRQLAVLAQLSDQLLALLRALLIGQRFDLLT